MVFGFAGAVLADFLLTAARKWTGMATPTGGRLAALAGLWIAVAVPVVRARNHRNLPVAAVPALLGMANALFHPDHAGLVSLPQAKASALLALDLFAFLVAMMAGWVIPAFTANALTAAQPRKNPSSAPDCMERFEQGRLSVSW